MDQVQKNLQRRLRGLEAANRSDEQPHEDLEANQSDKKEYSRSW